jgi:hypothetical protein
MGAEAVTFRAGQEIVFGVGGDERALEDRNFPLLQWLVVADVSVIDQRLDSGALYSQVPAFSASDRAMLDVLTTTHDGRLAAVELKADEDIHLPLQGLDYWLRVQWHHSREEFPRFGYFADRELSPEKALLYLAAPAFHVYPQTDVLPRYISPEIDWEFVGIDEPWREGVKVVFRKRPETLSRRERTEKPRTPALPVAS